MSRLLDRLDRITRGTPAPMGFGATARAEKLPSMAMLGLLAQGNEAGASLLASVGADAALIQGVDGAKEMGALNNLLGDIPWGVSLPHLDEEKARACLEGGCDFFAFSPEHVDVAALSEETPAYLLSVPHDLEERALRAIEELPVDGVVLTLEQVSQPLNLRTLMAVSAIRCMISKYLLLQLPNAIGPGELQGLRDIGVDGLLVDVASTSEAELKTLKEGLLALPRPRKARSGKVDALLPRGAYRTTSIFRREDDDDDDDDE